MDLMEYKAKELFAGAGLPVTVGFTADSVEELEAQIDSAAYPCMVKAQVQTGGRGKAGGIKAAANADELRQHVRDILGMDIKGHIVHKVLIAQRAEILDEWYLSITLDRVEKCPLIIFSPVGGMEIEQTAKTSPDKIVKLPIDPLVGVAKYHATYLVSKSGVDSKYEGQLLAILQNLYGLFLEWGCTLCEINPLAVTEGDKLVAVDAKISIDDSALFRHEELIALRDEMTREALVLEARKFRFLYIPCDAAGSVAVMSNGSGMIMSCIDVITKNGMTVFSALDLGGGATADRIKEGIRIVLSETHTKALFLNIFGGITRCDEVANGVKAFVDEYGSDKIIIVRFEGTNKEQGMAILESIGKPNVVFADGLYQGVAALEERRASL